MCVFYYCIVFLYFTVLQFTISMIVTDICDSFSQLHSNNKENCHLFDALLSIMKEGDPIQQHAVFHTSKSHQPLLMF